MKLSDAIDEYLSYRANLEYSPSTRRVDGWGLNRFLAEVGNIQCQSLAAVHGERFQTALLSSGLSARSVNQATSVAQRFARWCIDRRYISPTQHPFATTRPRRPAEKRRRRIPQRDFTRLLDCTDNPRDRIVVALGLYLFLRASEVSFLRIEHLDLQSGEIQVWQPKTSRWDVMPICTELEVELRRWLQEYADAVGATHGSMDPSWYLTPRGMPYDLHNPFAPRRWEPAERLNTPHVRVKLVLERYGWEVTADDREGCHTLRRSGARALFDHLVSSGAVRDGALRQVSAMLHHRSVSVTEHYLGLEVDREHRDALLKGRRMFAPPADNVVTLERDLKGA